VGAPWSEYGLDWHFARLDCLNCPFLAPVVLLIPATTTIYTQPEQWSWHPADLVFPKKSRRSPGLAVTIA
jgi:hypothetical protein